MDLDCPEFARYKCPGGYVFGFFCIGGDTKFPVTYYIPGKCICRTSFYCDIKSGYTFVDKSSKMSLHSLDYLKGTDEDCCNYECAECLADEDCSQADDEVHI